ncbi:MAG TPA: AMP-binding protein [Chryseolinea sp.]|nr:AMP-binding protein [Chryseolinea sp.]HPH46691.1 AMP-binding protein [Chryseolinea sp.]HPM31128.1 AMP-binding protein [Chryseolinea sp.]
MSNRIEIEFQSKEKIKNLQEEKLKLHLEYLSQHSPFYQKHFKQHNISIDRVRSVEDLVNIPPTTKDDLQNRNWDFLCVPKQKIIEYTSTSGTLGKPVIIALTEHDLQRLAYNESISFACADGTDHDLYQLMLTLDRQFMAGIAYYEGIRKLGAGLIRVGPGLPAAQWETIERLQPTALVAVPSFIMKLIEYAQQKNIDLNTSSVKKAICIGESLRTASFELSTLGKKIKEAWNIDLYGTYASTEMQTAFTECKHGRGGHQHPELVVVEILDEQNQPLKSGEAGEVTITTLGVEGMPLLRYKTGDIAIAYDDVCACGRTTMRLGSVLGRMQQMIKLKGTTIYPPGIFDIINQSHDVRDYVVEVYTGELGTDELKIHILADDEKKAEASLRLTFQSQMRVVPGFAFVNQAVLDQLQLGGLSRKIKKFIDSRK